MAQTHESIPRILHPGTPATAEQGSQWDQFFWSAYHKWRVNRNVTFPPHKVDGKEPDLNKLFLVVGAMGGVKRVGLLRIRL